MSETSMGITPNSDPKAGASSEGNVLSERIRERLTEESFLKPFGTEKKYTEASRTGGWFPHQRITGTSGYNHLMMRDASFVAYGAIEMIAE